MNVPVLKYGFFDDTRTFGYAHERHELGLQICGESWERHGFYVRTMNRFRPFDQNSLVLDFNTRSHGLQFLNNGKQVVRALERAGFYVKRQKGSHIVLRRDSPFVQVVVPDHKSVDTGTLASILDGADLSVEDFIKLIK